jgi:hypothetical protein
VDVRYPPSAERRTIASSVLEMTRGRGLAPNVRAANEWTRGTVAKERMGVGALTRAAEKSDFLAIHLRVNFGVLA